MSTIPASGDHKIQKRWPELDGLRGVAILLVMLLHYVTDNRTHEGNFGLLYRFAQIFRLGWSGVDLFFVLSGFLIGGILLDARSSPSYFRTFYIRRIHRILPIYYLWILLYAVIGYFTTRWVPSAAVPGLGAGLYFLFLQNILPTPASLFSHYFVSPTWSLAVEEQFYLVSPLVVRFLTPQKLTRALVACIVGAPVLRFLVYRLLAEGPNKALVLMPCRADALAMGMLAALAWRSPAKGWLMEHVSSFKTLSVILLLGAVAMVKWMSGPHNAIEAAIQYSWLAALYTFVLLISLLDEKSLFARVARWRFLGEWGRVSYCIYLIHLAILGMCHWIFFRSLPHLDDWPGFFVTVLAAALTWTLARLSWRYFEKPLIDRGHSYTYVSPSTAPKPAIS